MRGLTLIFGTALLFGACTPQEEAKPRVVRLGQVLDRTGSLATPSWADSIRLAVGTANQAMKRAGGPDLRFEVMEANSGNSPDMARAAARYLVTKKGAVAIITDSSQDDIAINALAYDGDPAHALSVPVVCMACTSSAIDDPAADDPDPAVRAALRNGQGWNFRTTMSDVYQARLLAQLLRSAGHGGDVNGDGRFKVSIYASDDPYGRSFSEALRKDLLAEAADVEQIFHSVQAQPGEYAWSADVVRLTDRRNDSTGRKDGEPDAVVSISFPKYEVSFTKAWIRSGTKVRLLHAHNFRSARVLEALGPSVAGQEGTSQAVVADGTSGRRFSEELHALTGQAPAFRDATAYDAANTLMLAALHALKKNELKDPAALTGAMVRDSMRAINTRGGERVHAGADGFARALELIAAGKPLDYEGASGPCDFDAHGDVVAQLARFRVEGQFVDVEKFDCVHDAKCPPLASLGAR